MEREYGEGGDKKKTQIYKQLRERHERNHCGLLVHDLGGINNYSTKKLYST